MLSQSKSLEFLIVQSISCSKLYFTFWAWLDCRFFFAVFYCMPSPGMFASVSFWPLFNYRARGTFGPSTLNYLLNGVANV